MSEPDLAAAMAQALGLPLVTAADYPQAPLFPDAISVRFLRERGVLPLAQSNEALALGVLDPLDSYAIDAVRLATGLEVSPRIAVPGDLEEALDRLYGQTGAMAAGEVEELDARTDQGLETDISRLEDQASEAPVIRLVNRLVTRAVEMRASDIHLESYEDGLQVRYRVDGVLQDATPPPNQLRAAIVSRIKILARLDIAERRLPQDGRIRLAVRGTPIDLRVATIPTMHGENVVLRVLNQEQIELSFHALGLEGQHLERYLKILDRPHGICLVTGPTGSGKTTTLYTSLVRLNKPEVKILTVEDPIEYQLERINQIQVKPEIGLDFADVLRSILRHDPDIILVGEIRDVDTAQIAIQAALTGHLVLSTLHTNNAASSISRLLDMGVDDYLVCSTLNGVTAQRLVRSLCPHCREHVAPSPDLVRQLDLERYANGSELRVGQPRGCSRCEGTGYRGRSCIVETLIMSDGFRELVLRRADASALQKAALAEGMRRMYDHGMEKVLAGETSLEEVLRVTRDR
ncbi:MAG: type II secretion system ATPase GspE [Kiloniellales bacterium]|nr:type II secretion system ATPase GspE [Kiloniellales bacterium]